MQENNCFDFNEITAALSYFRSLRFDLFWEKSQAEPVHSGKAKLLTDWSGGCEPEKLVSYLNPVFIREQILKTNLVFKNRSDCYTKILIEPLNTDDFKKLPLEINYSFSHGWFGKILIASTSVGICFVGFADEDDEEAMKDLKRRFPFGILQNRPDTYQECVIRFLENPNQNVETINLHLKGTPFQFAIWKELLQIPFGGLVSYGALTNDIKNARAAGTAVGDNPVAFLIPCHRVVRGNGEFGPYFWGADRKAVLICWEAFMAKKLRD
ncbi:methylated-DNA--[protein]-cysteine S-methyltransferase [Dyadobacter psychrotolerans]|uniref:Methylated-DNA--[protein]-cysteine S-methyltransferase n=1 Tax=Dyadobacter psychrotolerans TaxID=2541721 RepID=A0A4R5DHA2_9BACT|nr:methylated-DNA--[protein]-cysteine S-methyltransferase [Dyadobacter psychrotolerans]TDE11300.1 methylated-DNA--[protein]-cysteine S-methyltransferase [Dyadobacter psychrotolerans]